MRWHVVYVEACQGLWVPCWTLRHVCLQEEPRWVLLMACVLPCPLGLPLLLTPMWPSRYESHVPEPLLDPSRHGERKGSCLLCVSRGAWIKPNSWKEGASAEISCLLLGWGPWPVGLRVSLGTMLPLVGIGLTPGPSKAPLCPCGFRRSTSPCASFA